MRFTLFSFLSVLMLNSCVSSGIHQELKDTHTKLTDEHQKLEVEKQDLEDKNKELEQEVEALNSDLDEMDIENKKLNSERIAFKDQYDEIKLTYDMLLENNTNLLERSSSANQKMLQDLNKIRDELNKKEKRLIIKQYDLDSTKVEIEKKQKKINQLERSIADKEKAMSRLKTNITDALKSFSSKKLKIEHKNGRIYISLDNSLLFKSASWTIEKKGSNALKQIASVLSKHKDISILIEGHTDNDPLKSKPGAPIQDNWDLSVRRATEVVKTILKNKNIDPKQITAAGRGQYMPLVKNNTKENRAKNRRIDVILYPDFNKLEELIKSVK